MSEQPKKPTVQQIAEDLAVSMEVGGWFGYDYDEITDALIIETYTDDGEIDRTFTATITIKENA